MSLSLFAPRYRHGKFCGSHGGLSASTPCLLTRGKKDVDAREDGSPRVTRRGVWPGMRWKDDSIS